MLLAILATCSPEELEGEEEEEEYGEDEDLPVDLALPLSHVAERKQQIKNKILAVGKMQRVFQLLRCVSIAVWSWDMLQVCFRETMMLISCAIDAAVSTLLSSSLPFPFLPSRSSG